MPSTAPEVPLLHLCGAGRTYFDGVPIQALRPTDLLIEQGDYAAVMGASGSGKSTLLNLLGLLDRPSEGSYRVKGVETTAMSEPTRTAMRSQLFGFIFQSFHLMAGRSALDNVTLGMLYGPHARRGRRARAARALERVGLGHRLQADPRRLSGGERQRVAIARALAAGPRVLLCDEPTGNLDSASAGRILGLLEDLHEEGLTLIIVTHDPTVGRRARRMITVADGVVTADA